MSQQTQLTLRPRTDADVDVLFAIASDFAAIRAYEKAGFVAEGRQREHVWVRGRYEDIVFMGILRSERQPGGAAARLG